MANDHGRPLAVCPHLVSGSDDYYIWFTGRGIDRYWVCSGCSKRYPVRPVELLETTDAIVERCLAEAPFGGILGRPEVKCRTSSISFSNEEFSFRSFSDDCWVDIQPNPGSDTQWFVLLASGDFAIATPRVKDLKIQYRLKELGFEIDGETAFCVSPKADYGAVYQTSNRHACVFKLETGEITTRVDRGDYRPENSSFPVAFFERDGKSLLVAATSWNRLDVIDPASGEVLTKRGPTTYEDGEERPPHYLDYFHAQLLISPDGHWIVDNGWHWHPWGSVRSWNLAEWLLENPWESEDGRSVRVLADRGYYWDGPICWIDNSTVAVWGWGDDDESLLPAVLLMDCQTGGEVRWFPGPEVRHPNVWAPKKLAPALFFDEYLFSVHGEYGIAVWDISSGDRLLMDSSVIPVHYHPRAKEFLALTADGVRLSRLIS